MEISILLMKQIAELFLMILMGYLVVKAGIVTAEDSKVLSKIVLYLVIPCVDDSCVPGNLYEKYGKGIRTCICGIGLIADQFADRSAGQLPKL